MFMTTLHDEEGSVFTSIAQESIGPPAPVKSQK
jgi:hypothetical protein